MDKLLPCPFCGGDAQAMKPTARIGDEYKEWTRFFPIVRCRACYVTMNGDDHDWSCNTAIDKWNKRSLNAAMEIKIDQYEPKSAGKVLKDLANNQEPLKNNRPIE